MPCHLDAAARRGEIVPRHGDRDMVSGNLCAPARESASGARKAWASFVERAAGGRKDRASVRNRPHRPRTTRASSSSERVTRGKRGLSRAGEDRGSRGRCSGGGSRRPGGMGAHPTLSAIPPPPSPWPRSEGSQVLQAKCGQISCSFGTSSPTAPVRIRGSSPIRCRIRGAIGIRSIAVPAGGPTSSPESSPSSRRFRSWW